MEVIRVLFTRPHKTDFFATAIRAFTRSKFAHVGLEVRGFFLEAVEHGTVWSSTLRHRHTVVDSMEFEVTQEQLTSIFQYAASAESRPYDWWGVVAIAIYKIFGIRPSEKRSKERLFCSELIYWALHSASLCPTHEAPSLLDPQELWNFLRDARLRKDLV